MIKTVRELLFCITLLLISTVAQEDGQLCFLFGGCQPDPVPFFKINLTPISTFNGNAAEISAFDSVTKQLYITSEQAGDGRPVLDVVDLNNPVQPVQSAVLDLSPYGTSVTSVAIHSPSRLMAVAMPNENLQENGSVQIFQLSDTVGDASKHLETIEVGALPDMVTFTPNGEYILVANEGEPNDAYTLDPVGSISIIEVKRRHFGRFKFKTKTAGFESYNGRLQELLSAGVRIFGPSANVAEDLEPEFITVSEDSKTAWVSLQENNAMAIVDIKKATVTSIVALGFKNHNLLGNELDASDDDGAINIANWPVFGMYQPDGISAFQVGGKTYIASANEGDDRDYNPGLREAVRVEDFMLDAAAFPTATTLQEEQNLGRLRATNTLGDINGDGFFNQLYSFGTRSFAIWDADANLLWDSGSQFAKITEAERPEIFNADNSDPADFDSRSDVRGCEPESVVTGNVNGRTFAFVGLERTGGVMVYDVTVPTEPVFNQWAFNDGDASPEGLAFISADESPFDGTPLLVVSHEESGTTTVYSITPFQP